MQTLSTGVPVTGAPVFVFVLGDFSKKRCRFAGLFVRLLRCCFGCIARYAPKTAPCRRTKILRNSASFFRSIALLVLFGGPAHAEDRLQEIVDLARVGAAQLAVRAMDAHQPDVEEDLQAWLLWERERAFVLLSQGRWRQLTDRLASPAEGLPADFHDWVREMRARAFLNLGQGDAGRRELGRNIWSSAGVAQREDLARWRRLVIQAYLADGLDEDADRAMVRYRQDYGDAGEEWPVLRAKVLLRTRRPEAALLALSGKTGADAEILRQLAALRGGTRMPKQVLRTAKALLAKPKQAPILRAQAWSLSAQAAARMGMVGSEAQSLEGALGQSRIMSRSHPLAVSGDALWAAYKRYGLAAANKASLLLGDEKAWLALAGKSARTPVKARALLATLALGGTTEGQRRRAHAALVRGLLKTDFGPHLLPRLYLQVEAFPTARDIPFPVRHALADLYLGQGRISEASAMVSGLDRTPEGSDPFDWQLRRGRILLLAGHVEEGYAGLVQGLNELLADAELRESAAKNEAPEPLDPGKVDRLLQVVFDLQALERHDLARAVFRRLLQAPLIEKQKRELYFWSGESAEALGDKQEAALLYLRSAMYPDLFAMDLWAQTARFQAAKLLAEQGLVADARNLYQGLLDVTEDPARRAVLEQRMQRLMLRRRER